MKSLSTKYDIQIINESHRNTLKAKGRNSVKIDEGVSKIKERKPIDMRLDTSVNVDKSSQNAL